VKKITQEMILSDVIEEFPDIIQIFHKYNLHCLGCMLAKGESLKDGLLGHGLNVDEVINEMNELLDNQTK